MTPEQVGGWGREDFPLLLLAYFACNVSISVTIYVAFKCKYPKQFNNNEMFAKLALKPLKLIFKIAKTCSEINHYLANTAKYAFC